ncbi:hypothetical protein [Halomonas getboli]|uniref:hypothetical protein n=1 Tax=Halomonas getboli TaxID=2935862 RepID=UPI001FFFAD41|nr:hypothetical protein [Halomonas getboli]MCK2185706.1 hypothetical protein [Halomonas getboli]
MAHRDPETLIAELEGKVAQRGVRMRALEGRVRALEDALLPFAEAWAHRAPRPVDHPRAYQRRLERALAGFYSSPRDDGEGRLILTGQHLKDAHDLLVVRDDTSHTNEKDGHQ